MRRSLRPSPRVPEVRADPAGHGEYDGGYGGDHAADAAVLAAGAGEIPAGRSPVENPSRRRRLEPSEVGLIPPIGS